MAVVASVAACGAEEPASVDRLRESGVGIVAEGCGLTAQLASGVVLGRPGYVVTVAHAIAGATTVSVVDHTGRQHRASVRAFDKDRDLAILAVADLDAPVLELAAGDIGPAATLTWSRSDGVTHAAVEVTKRLKVTIEDIYIEEVVERQGIEVIGEVAIGHSGGPVISSTGEVMGIVYARSRVRDGVGFATAASEVEALLSSTSPADVANGRCS